MSYVKLDDAFKALLEEIRQEPEDQLPRGPLLPAPPATDFLEEPQPEPQAVEQEEEDELPSGPWMMLPESGDFMEE